MTLITTPLGLFVGICALTDLRNQKIPNAITLPAAILALAYHISVSGLAGFYWSAGGWSLGLALLIIPYTLKAMGAGDVKLLAAIGALVGPIAVTKVFLYAALVGGAYALLHRTISQDRFGFSGELFQIIKHFILYRKLLAIKRKPEKKGSPLCYGLAIAAGTYIYIGEIYGVYKILGA